LFRAVALADLHALDGVRELVELLVAFKTELYVASRTGLARAAAAWQGAPVGAVLRALLEHYASTLAFSPAGRLLAFLDCEADPGRAAGR
jgi:hypothetical protein